MAQSQGILRFVDTIVRLVSAVKHRHVSGRQGKIGLDFTVWHFCAPYAVVLLTIFHGFKVFRLNQPLAAIPQSKPIEKLTECMWQKR